MLATETTSVPLNNQIIHQIIDKYTLLEPTNVLAYLAQHKNLTFALLEAEKQIRKQFLHEKLTLKIVYDPEIPHWEKLFIIINTQLDADTAFDQLKQLDQDWWLDASDLVNNDLEIHIDFDEI
ncbi:hypothetical protein IQ219_05555 [Synechocystis sp. LEGE 06083]|uniref:hypothetical protein n=1 Tax=Synechocystis sp. LEGE 06083 TaxID=915336 RepID=UPI0018818B66|nr:hypothetical protein [Synechocystis sp. LEGE 06083]MBE9194784.1 hypothetical protein [Synechocystis sp. LEGE 06083]